MTTISNRFVSSVSYQNCFQDLLSIANRYPEKTGFVPCVGNKEGKKIPLKGADNWENGSIVATDLTKFDRMTMLAIVLGNQYIAVDCDGHTAINYLEDKINLELPETLTISSIPGKRQALIFKLSSKKCNFFKIDTGEKEQLEFRTGEQYQVIAGIHPKTKEPYYTNNLPIADIPENLYRWIKQFNADIKKTKKLNDIELPLIYFLTASDRSVINSGISNNRNNRGISLALNLQATQDRLKELNIKFFGTAEDLFYQYCEKCDPTDWTREEWDTIWKSASSRNSEPCFTDEYLLELSRVYDPNETLETNLENTLTDIFNYKYQRLQAEIQKYSSENISASEITIKANQIFTKIFDRQPTYIDKQIVANICKRLSELAITPEIIELTHKALDKLDESDKVTLDVDWIMQGLNINFALKKQSTENNIPIDNLFVSYLTVVSSLLPKKLEYNFNTNSNTHGNLFTLIIGSATCGKSITVDPLKKPLEKLANGTHNNYIADLKEYQRQLEIWRERSKEEKEAIYLQTIGSYDIPLGITTREMRDTVIPEPKRNHQHVISDASFEAVQKLSGELKEYGILVAPDEIVDFLKSIERINKSKGALSQLIPVWNGSSTLKSRASVTPEEADFYRVSLLSTIQTDRFYDQFDIKDSSGITSRFLYVKINEPIRIPSKMSSDDGFNFERIMQDNYSFIQDALTQNETVVKPSVNAHSYWSQYRTICENSSDDIKDINPGFCQWLNRQPLQCARIALIIHVLRYTEGLENSLLELSEQSMLRAIAVSRYFVSKAQSIFRQSVTKGTESLDQEKLFMLRDFVSIYTKILVKNKTKILKLTDVNACAFIRRKDVIAEYAVNKRDSKYLKKVEIISLFEDIHAHGLAKYQDGCLIFD